MTVAAALVSGVARTAAAAAPLVGLLDAEEVGRTRVSVNELLRARADCGLVAAEVVGVALRGSLIVEKVPTMGDEASEGEPAIEALVFLKTFLSKLPILELQNSSLPFLGSCRIGSCGTSSTFLGRV